MFELYVDGLRVDADSWSTIKTFMRGATDRTAVVIRGNEKWNIRYWEAKHQSRLLKFPVQK